MNELPLFEDVPMPEIRIPELAEVCYPYTPGAQATDTSREAAEAIAPDASGLRAQCLELLKKEALTADECASRLKVSILSIRPRVAELNKQGKIADTGERRAVEYVKRTVRHIVWRAIS